MEMFLLWLEWPLATCALPASLMLMWFWTLRFLFVVMLSSLGALLARARCERWTIGQGKFGPRSRWIMSMSLLPLLAVLTASCRLVAGAVVL